MIAVTWEEEQAWASRSCREPPFQTMEAAISSSKHKRSHDKVRDSSSRKRAKHSKKSSKRNEDHLHVLDDDINDEDMWVEKNVDMEGEKVLSDS